MACVECIPECHLFVTLNRFLSNEILRMSLFKSENWTLKKSDRKWISLKCGIEREFCGY